MPITACLCYTLPTHGVPIVCYIPAAAASGGSPAAAAGGSILESPRPTMVIYAIVLDYPASAVGRGSKRKTAVDAG